MLVTTFLTASRRRAAQVCRCCNGTISGITRGIARPAHCDIKDLLLWPGPFARRLIQTAEMCKVLLYSRAGWCRPLFAFCGCITLGPFRLHCFLFASPGSRFGLAAPMLVQRLSQRPLAQMSPTRLVDMTSDLKRCFTFCFVFFVFFGGFWGPGGNWIRVEIPFKTALLARL